MKKFIISTMLLLTLSITAAAEECRVSMEFHRENAQQITGRINRAPMRIPIDVMYDSDMHTIEIVGFTDREISQMLVANNAEETTLIPFVISLVEEELKCGSGVDIPTAIRCAQQAIGFDIFYALNQSVAKTWSKAVLKKIFKTVAAKVIGPVGTIIFVIDFALCMEGIM